MTHRVPAPIPSASATGAVSSRPPASRIRFAGLRPPLSPAQGSENATHCARRTETASERNTLRLVTPAGGGRRRGQALIVTILVVLAGCHSGGRHPASGPSGGGGSTAGGTAATDAAGTAGAGPSRDTLSGSGGGGSAAGGARGAARPSGVGAGDGSGSPAGGGSGGGGGHGPVVGAPTDPGAGPARSKGWRKLAASPLRGRHSASAVWTGREMVVWGGAWRAGNANIWLDDGAAYDPVGDRWRRIASSPLPSRAEAFAAWTGKEVLLWGGRPGTQGQYGYDEFVDGALYDPAKDRWRPMAAFPLGPRWGARVVWTGTHLVVWGGARAADPDDAPRLADGAAYDPAANTWKKLPASPLSGRVSPMGAPRNGSALLSWGYGQDNAAEPASAMYDPDRGKWTPAAPTPPPGDAGRCLVEEGCTGIDTGQRLVFTGEGLAWNPSADRWAAIAPGPFANPQLDGAGRAWTGTRVMAFGGGVYGGGDGPEAPPATVRTDAASYDPVADRWDALPPPPLAGRARIAAVWTGREFIVWGGEGEFSHRADFADGAALTP